MMGKAMAMRKRGLELARPNAAGVDVGSASHFVAVSPDRDDHPVRKLKSFTYQLNQIADWLGACSVDTVAMESSGVYLIPLFELVEARGFTVLRAISPQRDMLLSYQSRHIQHMLKALAQINVQLGNVISDIAGERGLKIVRAIIAGERDRVTLARLKNGHIRASESRRRALLKRDRSGPTQPRRSGQS